MSEQERQYRISKAQHCVGVYERAARAATVAGDMSLAKWYGERISMWIQRLDTLGHFDSRREAFYAVREVA